MDLHLTVSGRHGLATQLYRQLRDAILEGRIRSGDNLPPTRELADRLNVSRNTVTAAYERLTSEGFLSARVGSGTFVRSPIAPAEQRRNALSGTGLRPLPVWDRVTVGPERPARKPAFDFRAGIPDARLFPFAAWRRLVTRELHSAENRKALYQEPSGLLRLRQAIARHVGVARSIQATAEDILITNGTQQALDLIGRVLWEPGAVVAMEDPGYPMARLLFQSQGARVHPVPLDAEGLEVDALPENAAVVYTTPSHQFPLGMPMSLARRMALLSWAERRRAAIIEDDYDSEFRFDDRPLEPLQSLDRGGRVIYVGSFSKTLLPELRVGYLIAPPSIRPALRAAKALTDWHSPLTTQAALARFMEEGLLARHVRRARKEYQSRRDRLVSAIERHLGTWAEPAPSVAGLHLCALFRDERLHADEVARAANAEGIAVYPLSRFSTAPTPPQGLVLGYGSIPVNRIDEGVRRLAAVLAATR